MYLRHFTLEKAKATGVINGGIISGIYLLTCDTAEGAWTGAVGGGIAGASRRRCGIAHFRNSTWLCRWRNFRRYWRVANGSWYLITGGD